MDKVMLKKYAEAVRKLLDAAPSSSSDANFFRSNDYLQMALLDAAREEVDVPRGDDGLFRWMLEFSERDGLDVLEAVACFLLLLKGQDLP